MTDAPASAAVRIAMAIVRTFPYPAAFSGSVDFSWSVLLSTT